MSALGAPRAKLMTSAGIVSEYMSVGGPDRWGNPGGRGGGIAAVVVVAAVALGVASASPAAKPRPATNTPRPRIQNDPIPFGKDRKRETAGYAKRHYGLRTWRLRDPR